VTSHTLDLIDYLAAQGHELRLVIGADILDDAAKWHRWDDVCARAPLIVVGRVGYGVPHASAATGVTMPEVSATRVRDLLATGGSDVSGLVPREVLRYIAHHHLYQS
jgi:nicotinic acid mononucleotide adenylyltransferase